MYQRYPPHRRLIKADSLETFLAHRFPSAKRFGLEGAEATIPGIQAVVDAAAAVGRNTPVDLSGHVTTTYILDERRVRTHARTTADIFFEKTTFLTPRMNKE